MNKNIRFLAAGGATLLALTGCDNPVEKVMHLTSGYMQEVVLDSFNEGKLSDDMKKTNLKIIKDGVADLERMNDPNLAEVHKAIDSHLKDNDLSMYDFNTINSIIQKHKRSINKKNSNHKNDVIEFKDSM